MAQSAEPGGGISGATLALLKYVITPSQWGSGVKDWNAHHFPTGSRAYKPTAPRPDVSTRSRVLKPQQRLMVQKKKKCKIITKARRPLYVLLKTSDNHVLQFHWTKRHITRVQEEVLSNTFWSSLSGELCWFIDKHLVFTSCQQGFFLHFYTGLDKKS